MSYSLMEFAKGTPEEFQKYVKTLLNELSCNEHEKYLKYLANKSAPNITVTSANNSNPAQLATQPNPVQPTVSVAVAGTSSKAAQ